MKAAILAVGSELLGSTRLDTNSLRLTETLRRYGVALLRKSVVGDSVALLAAEIRHALRGAELVLITGGLGPTADDVTRDAVAAALGRGMTTDAALLEEIRAKFARFKMRMPEVNRKQAEVLDGATVLANPRGTAPGMRLHEGAATIFLFPGVPFELEGMIGADLEPWLRERSAGEETETVIVRIACLPESTVEERIEPAYREFGREWISILASPGDIQVRLSARDAAAARSARLAEMTGRVRELVGDAVYSVDGSPSLEQEVGRLLREKRLSIVTAESCTGGLLAERLTRVAGSSGYFLGAAVTYADRLKQEQLGVKPATLERWGAVSAEVVREMAEGAVQRLGGDLAVAISGVAGPGGGSEEKPVGTVHFALAGPAGNETICVERSLPGDRERVRRLASQWALDLLRRRLLGLRLPRAAAPEIAARNDAAQAPSKTGAVEIG